jgi:hypothetical protein
MCSAPVQVVTSNLAVAIFVYPVAYPTNPLVILLKENSSVETVATNFDDAGQYDVSTGAEVPETKWEAMEQKFQTAQAEAEGGGPTWDRRRQAAPPQPPVTLPNRDPSGPSGPGCTRKAPRPAIVWLIAVEEAES